MIDYGGVFISFFAVIDPIGTVPVFIAITRGYGATEKRKIALKGTFFAAAVLLFFVYERRVCLEMSEHFLNLGPGSQSSSFPVQVCCLVVVIDEIKLKNVMENQYNTSLVPSPKQYKL